MESLCEYEMFWPFYFNVNIKLNFQARKNKVIRSDEHFILC